MIKLSWMGEGRALESVESYEVRMEERTNGKRYEIMKILSVNEKPIRVLKRYNI
jgi:hypothetical protein